MVVPKTYNFLYDCELEALDFIHFASLEIERRVIIQPVIHNYALTYAIFLANSRPAFLSQSDSIKPKYKEDLNEINELGIYVTPAYGLSVKISSYIWGAKEELLTYRELQVTKNYPPSMVRQEAISPNSRFRFFILSNQKIKLPRIIRLGKKRSPASINAKIYELKKIKPDKPYIVKILNPWDLPKDANFEGISTVINIPPNRLFQDAVISSNEAYYSKDLKVIFPAFSFYARSE